ncbi:hypothetical protein JL720_16417 [Aureococcus anophagefferens]|nr:hypothetical protein JL720_16417 [Aureococcus anophagefferens]
MAEDDEQPAEEAGGETEAASAWNILQSPAGKLVAAAGGGFVAYQCLRAASAIGDDAPAHVQPPAPAAAAPAPAPAAAAPAPAPAAAGDAEDAEDGKQQRKEDGKKRRKEKRRAKKKRKEEEKAKAAAAPPEAPETPRAPPKERREATPPPPPRRDDDDDDRDEEAAAAPPPNHFRYEAYKRATSGAAFLALGGTVADLRYDLGRGFVVAGAPRRAHKNCGALVVAVPKTSYDLDADAVDDDGQHSDDECEPAAESGLYGRKRKQRTLFSPSARASTTRSCVDRRR